MRRRLAREMAVQGLYHIDMNEVEPDEAVRAIVDEVNDDNEGGIRQANEPVSPAFVLELVEGAHKHRLTIDELLQNYLKGWQIDRLSKVDRQILRLAVFEMLYKEDVPPKVVVNEAIELAKHFGTDESGKFVNGVLGKLILELDAVKERLVAKHEQS